MWLNELWIQRWKSFPFNYTDRFPDSWRTWGSYRVFSCLIIVLFLSISHQHLHHTTNNYSGNSGITEWNVMYKFKASSQLAGAAGCNRAHQLDFESGALQRLKFDNQSDDLATNWQCERCQNLRFSSQNITGVAESLFSSFSLEGVQFPTRLLSEHGVVFCGCSGFISNYISIIRIPIILHINTHCQYSYFVQASSGLVQGVTKM